MDSMDQRPNRTGTIGSATTFATMPTSEECRHNAEVCLKLASETNEIYVKTALIELATELHSMAEHLERRAQRDRES
jgi:hypothetical protein